MMTEKPPDKVAVVKLSKSFNCFHCPIPGCLYHEGSERHFTNKRLLNQHLAKMHAEKKYLCSKCQKGFGLDWWRKYHEKSCGKQWKCSCGMCYSSRESLLTHARRNYHNLPSDVYCPKRKNMKNAKSQPAAQSVIIIIPVTADKQPQNIPYIYQTSPDSLLGKPRPILPKGSLPAAISVPTASGLQDTLSQDVEKNSVLASNEASITTCDGDTPVSTICTSSDLSGTFELLQSSSPALNEKHNSLKKTAVETQTIGEYTLHLTEISDARRKESRGSQCSGSVRKQNVHIESTETQTLESALVKMKRKTSMHRHRKKSVAIATSLGMNHAVPTSQPTAWSRLENFLFPNPDDLSDSWKRLNRYSSSTQTSHTDCSSKILCDTQTITDDLFQFNWQLNSETKSDTSKLSSEMGTDFTENFAGDLNESNLGSDMPILEMFSSTDTSLCSLTSNGTPVDQVTNQNLDSSGQDSNSVLSPMFSSCLVPEEPKVHKNDAPVLSHTQTQTTTAPDFDYNGILSNMETQTTDDFLLTDLEFLDMETQTPWEDISNIEDSLPVDQLSIEIQTDFPYLNTSVADDPYDMLSMLQNCTNKLSDSVNMETQTQYSMESPELTNSSAQTLDLPTYLFN